MGNMSYCRFENTYKDLLDCQEALSEHDGIAGCRKKANEYERPYVANLVALCKEIVDEFGDELEEIEKGSDQEE
jgi:hypothetical protein